MFGDWNGQRTRLENRGVTFSFQSVNDFLLDGQGDAANWSRVRGTMDVDFGKAELVPGLKFHVTGLWQGGGNMGSYIGSIANPTSLLSANTARLDSWWFEQAMFDQKLFVKLGQFAGQDFYGVQQDGASYVMEPLGYALGNLFGSTYETFDPAATPAAEIRVVPSRHFYVKSAIFSGNRNPYADDPNGFHFKFKNSPIIATEAGYLVAPGSTGLNKTYPGAYKFGATVNPGPFPNLVTGVSGSGNYLLYFMANQAVYRRFAGSTRGLDLNFAVDWSPGDVSRVFSQVTGGVRYNGLLPRRDRDTLAFGIVYSRISDQLSRAYVSQGLSPFGSEKALEINYAFAVTRWFTFQPVVQHYLDTGANPQGRNSTVAGFRTSFTL